ncbi:MAG TPA: serine/threonine-protein kinase [Ktedonobacteraceae bacterium]|nr:serine/threonine-protein kinase [Ktedonobacteraceae bacterium]
MQERFNRYCLTKEIASKPYGSVYLAHRINHVSQKVALKIFKATSFTSEQQGQNFLQKVERIRQLKHSSIVQILDLGVEQGHPYVVREYLTSSSLRHRLDGLSPQRLDLQEVLSIIFQIGQALSYAHEHNILHGNLKPENIFFKDDGEVLLTDFGLTSFTDMTKLDDKSHRQTTSYLAPEQLVGSITEKSDQYALACLAYELITGCAPFSAQSFSLVVSPLSLDGGPTKASERQESDHGDQTGLVQAESACENNQCPDYGKVGGSNIRKFGKTRKGVQRWQCKTCQMTWSASSMSAKQQRDLIPLTDLVPNLPEPIEEVMLKAMAKDPSERYADISIFLRTLQVALLLPTPAFTDSMIASPVTPLATSIMMPFEKTQSEAPLTAPLLERWKYMQNDYHASKILAISNSDTYHPNKPTAIPNSDTYHPSKPTAIPNSDTYHPNRPTPIPNSGTYHPNKPVTKPKIDAYRANKDLIETLPEGRPPQPSQPLAPTLWLAFALSGIALLLGTVVLYALVPSHSPGSSKHVNSSPTVQPPVQVSKVTTVKPPVQITTVTTATPTTVSTQPKILPSLSNNCTGPGWSRPSNNANNDYPDNAYYVVTLNGDASCYKANWVIPTGPTVGQTCDFVTLFTRGTNAQVIYTFITNTGTKIPFNVNITSPVWMTFSSLADITSIQLVAQGNHQSGTTMSAGPFTTTNCH